MDSNNGYSIKIAEAPTPKEPSALPLILIQSRSYLDKPHIDSLRQSAERGLKNGLLVFDASINIYSVDASGRIWEVGNGKSD